MAQHTHTQAGDARALESDWGLVAAARAGETDAFGELFTRYQSRIGGLVYAKTGDRDLAQDVTSETFTRALGAVDRVRPDREGTWPWLSRIATNAVRDHYRRSETRRTSAVEDIPEPRREQHGGLAEDSATRAVAGMEARAARSTVGRLLAGLPAAQREAVEGWMAEESQAETGARVGRSGAAVKAARHRAWTTIRARLAAEGITTAEQALHAGHPRRNVDEASGNEQLAEAVGRARGSVAALRSAGRQVSDDPATRAAHQVARTGEERTDQGSVDGRVDGVVGLGVAS
jgi:RNA polymerase sigma-70 factor (ECF subfamily)